MMGLSGFFPNDEDGAKPLGRSSQKHLDRDGIRLVCGDCLEIMKTMESGSVDAVVTDPPYNLNYRYGKYKDDLAGDEYKVWCARWLAELKRVCAGPILISTGIVNIGMWSQIAQPEWWLCWWKPAAMGHCKVGVNNWEPIAFYGRPIKKFCDVIRAPIVASCAVQGHPCPKPLEWATKQIELVSEVGHVLFDPFLGSGTTGVAARKLRRKFIGVELDETYFRIAQKRIYYRR